MIFLLGLVQASNIVVRLLSKQEWISPTIQEQIAVGLQQHDAKDPFEIINAVHQSKSDQEMFKELDLARESFFNEYSLDLLKTGIANNQYAVAVQAHYHYYTNYVAGTDCDCWVDSGSEKICTASELKLDVLKATVVKDPAKLLDVDIKYHKDASSRKIAILYSNLRVKCFSGFYKALKGFAEEDDDFSFILRFIPPKNGSDFKPITLSGYGVELALKNTEYQAVDDRLVDQKSASAKETGKSPSDNQDILWEDVPSIEPLTKDELQSIAAVGIAFSRNSLNPLSTLSELCGNFPKFAHLITASEKSVKEVASASSALIQSVTGGSQIMLLNGIPFDLERLNVFEILQKMRSENAMIQQLKNIGLTVPQSISFASEPLQSEEDLSWGDTFDTVSDAVIFLNDIEKDPMYHQFPSSFYSLLQPSMQNQFKFIRRNLFTVVIVLDFTNLAQLSELMRILSIIRQKAPMKFGIIPFLSKEDEKLSKLIALSLSHLSVDPQKIVEFIGDIFQSVEKGKLDELIVQMIFEEHSGKKGLDLVAKESLEIFQKIVYFNERLGMTKEGGMFGNGGMILFNSSIHSTCKRLGSEHCSKLLQNDSIPYDDG
jgi:UDP-glucose:glycoprotein glucosyltransferase